MMGMTGAVPGVAGGGMGKMMVMLPVMYYSRQLDSEDPNVVFMLRCSYAAATVITLLMIAFLHTKVSSSTDADTVVYVPKAAGFMDDPKAPKKYTKSSALKLQNDKIQELIQQTGMSMLMTCGLHYYKGMVMGLAMQSVMGPFGLYENPLVQKFLLSSDKEKRFFGEKTEDEITDEDTIIEMKGMEEVVIRAGTGVAIAAEGDESEDKKDEKDKKDKKKAIKDDKGLDDVLLDTWDMAAEADLKALAKKLTRGNVNSTTDESKWTPLMIVCGLKGAAGVDAAIKECAKLGADCSSTDVEGWTALHWAAFHGNPPAATSLCEHFDVTEMLDKNDKEGKSVKMLCQEENNMDVWKAIEEGSKSVGLRQRKAAAE